MCATFVYFTLGLAKGRHRSMAGSGATNLKSVFGAVLGLGLEQRHKRQRKVNLP